MTRINKSEFIEVLLNQIDRQIEFGESLLLVDHDLLTNKENPDKWNAMECIQHMSQSMQLYTDQLITIQLKSVDEKEVKIGWKGNFFAEGMRPKGDTISYKMKTMKVFEPNTINDSSIDNYISLLKLIKLFVNENQYKSWNRSKVKTALGSLVKLNIAEAINFVLAHCDRHILQAKKAMTKMAEVR